MSEFKVLENTNKEKEIVEEEKRKWRHYIVYQIAGDWNKNHSGYIKFFINENEYEFKGTNIAIRLDNIFRDLLKGKTSEPQLQDIINYFGHPLTVADLLSLKIEVDVFDDFTSQYNNLSKSLPKKGGGVYILKFPNGKKYIGSSAQLKKKILENVRFLLEMNSGGAAWHKKAREENFLIEPNDIQVDCIVGQGVKTKEKELLKSIPIEERKNYYNTIFY